MCLMIYCYYRDTGNIRKPKNQNVRKYRVQKSFNIYYLAKSGWINFTMKIPSEYKLPALWLTC